MTRHVQAGPEVLESSLAGGDVHEVQDGSVQLIQEVDCVTLDSSGESQVRGTIIIVAL